MAGRGVGLPGALLGRLALSPTGFGKAQAIWGSVVAAFFVNAILGAVQVSSQSGGLYGIDRARARAGLGPDARRRA